MKKIVGSILLLMLVFLTSACGNAEEKTLNCTLYTKDVVSNYELNSNYTITYKGNVVSKVESTEVVNSDDTEVLDYFEEYLNSTYTTMDENYGGYTFNVEKTSDTVTSTTKIDYSKVDLVSLGKDQPAMKNALDSDNNLTLDGVISIYESLGVTCDSH